jgi:hypothetical protein
MSAQHTPGPWKWWTSNSWRRLRRDDFGIAQTVLEPCVATDGHPDVTVSEADMALIAAAPELLAALQSLIDRIEDMPGLLNDLHEEMAEAYLAVRKAEGLQ